MSVRVNLLPQESADRERASRARAGVVAGFVVLLLVLGGVYYLQTQRVDEAQEVVATEQATLQALQADRAELEEYEELRTLRDQGHQVLQSAMGMEASMAGVMQDIASVMPPDAQLDSLSVTVTEPADPELGDVRAAYGAMSLTGQTRLGHAPGLERFLLEFDKIAAFTDLYFSNSTLDERGVATFNADVDLGAEVLTNRYADGLPEVLR